MIRALGLLPYPTDRAPGQRYRIEQWAPLLAAEGVQVTFAPFLSHSTMDVLYQRGHAFRKLGESVLGYWRRARTLTGPLPFDVAYVYREMGPFGTAWLEGWLRRRLPFVFDFDDAIYLRSVSEANSRVAWLKSQRKTSSICRIATAVTVGNENLAQYAGHYSSAVTVIPSTIDTEAYQILPRGPNPRPVVGWTGSSTTVRYLTAIAPALRELRRRIDFELLVIGSEIQLPDLHVRCVRWQSHSEVADLRPLDVGLMPLEDDEWSRGKCGMKALQYMALGIPPVVSPVGVNAQIVKHAVNGLHARHESEWVDGIERLLRDVDLRARLGSEARRTVEERFSARVHAPRMAGVLRMAALATRP